MPALFDGEAEVAAPVVPSRGLRQGPSIDVVIHRTAVNAALNTCMTLMHECALTRRDSLFIHIDGFETVRERRIEAAMGGSRTIALTDKELWVCVQRLVGAGHRRSDIAAILGVSERAANRIAAVRFRPECRPGTISVLVHASKHGLSSAEAAKKARLSIAEARKWLRRYGRFDVLEALGRNDHRSSPAA